MGLKELRNLLPINGLKVIAERTGIPYTEITRMFNGLETKRTPIVVEATAKYLEELEAQRTKAKEAITGALNGI